MNRTLFAGVALPTIAAIVLAFALSAPPSAAQESAPEYVGSETCKTCHYKEHKYWKKSGLAKAMDILKPTPEADAERFARKKAAGLDPAKDYTTDAKCLGCHTTGYGLPGGYPANATASPESKAQAELMGSVSCESCHGPGSNYVKHKKAGIEADEDAKFPTADLLKIGLVLPDEKNCAGCHNDQGPTHATDEFDFDKDKSRVHTKPKKKKKKKKKKS